MTAPDAHVNHKRQHNDWTEATNVVGSRWASVSVDHGMCRQCNMTSTELTGCAKLAGTFLFIFLPLSVSEFKYFHRYLV